MELLIHTDHGRKITIDAFCETVALNPLHPGDERVIEALSRIGEKLMTRQVSREFPDLVPLGFFLRKRRLQKLAQSLREHSQGRISVPRGTIFHVPPANVDAVFAYSWALSFLSGNANIVRVSDRRGPSAAFLLSVILEVLNEVSPEVANSQIFVSFNRSDLIIEKLSMLADMRVFWGGDETVSSLRSSNCKPSCRDLLFPDRFSMAVINSEGWLLQTKEECNAGAQLLFNDAYWFNQAACSSPRALVFVGSKEANSLASFSIANESIRFELVKSIAEDASLHMDRYTGGIDAIMDGSILRMDEVAEGITYLFPAEGQPIDRKFRGTGTFIVIGITKLEDLAKYVTRKDQTLVHFGFSLEDLENCAQFLNGIGIDRMVPLGSALSFDEVWDGEDFLAEFTRIVTIR